MKASKLTVKSDCSLKNATKTKSQFKKIIKEIKQLKLDLKKSIQEDDYLSEKYKEDLSFIDSIELQSLNSKKTMEELSDINRKLKSILLNLQKDYNKPLCTEKQTKNGPKEFQKIEKQSKKTRKQLKAMVKQIRKQILDFKKFLREDNHLAEKYEDEFLFIGSIELPTLADNNTWEQLSDLNEKLKSIILNLRDEQKQYTEASDSWTQTDFSPAISFDIFNELNEITQFQYPALRHMEILTQKLALNEQVAFDLEKEREQSCEKFHSLSKKKKYLINLTLPNKFGDDSYAVSESYKLSMNKPNPLLQSDVGEIGTQTEISTLSIGVNFGEIILTDDLHLQIKNIHGRLIHLSDRKNYLIEESKRFICYCDNLYSGEEIEVIDRDLPNEIETDLKMDKFIVTATSRIEEAKTYAKKLEKFPKIFKRFEDEIKFVKSIKLPFTQNTTFREKFETLQTLSERLTPIHQKLQKLTENIEKHKNKNVNEINRLISRVLKKKNNILRNYPKEKFSLVKDAFESDFDFVDSIKLSRQSDASQEILNQDWKNVKKIDYKLNGIQEKFNKFCKEQSEFILSDSRTNLDGTGSEDHQKNKMKSKDPGDQNISKSEYELLLKEKDDLIAEYLSVMDSNYFYMRYIDPIDVVDRKLETTCVADNFEMLVTVKHKRRAPKSKRNHLYRNSVTKTQ